MERVEGPREGNERGLTTVAKNALVKMAAASAAESIREANNFIVEAIKGSDDARVLVPLRAAIMKLKSATAWADAIEKATVDND
jgi:hypothetical protein